MNKSGKAFGIDIDEIDRVRQAQVDNGEFDTPNNQYLIMYNNEEIDFTDTADKADWLLAEYRIAFGSSAALSIKEN